MFLYISYRITHSNYADTLASPEENTERYYTLCKQQAYYYFPVDSLMYGIH